MANEKVLGAVWPVFILLHIVISKVWSINFKDAVFGKQMSNGRITTLTKVSLISCTEECSVRPPCASVNYLVSLHICELNNKSYTDDDAKHLRNTKAIYIEKDVFESVSIDRVSLF